MMRERVKLILLIVAARGGNIPPYASNEYDAYVSDVAAVKAVVDKQSLPVKAAFISILVKAAAAWGLKNFDQACSLPRPQLFVVKLLAGLGGLKYDARTVSGYMSNRDILLEMEKRIAAGTMDPRSMPANIQYLIVGNFSKRSLQAKLQIVEAAQLPLTRTSLVAAMPRDELEDADIEQDLAPSYPENLHLVGVNDALSASEILHADDVHAARQIPVDIEATPSATLEGRSHSQADDAMARIMRTTAEIGVPYDPSFLDSPEFKSAMAKHCANRYMAIANAYSA